MCLCDFSEEPSLCASSHNISGFPRPHRHKVGMVPGQDLFGQG